MMDDDDAIEITSLISNDLKRMNGDVLEVAISILGEIFIRMMNVAVM